MVGKIGIFYHSDPAGHVPSGIDTFIRGILEYAPNDLDYTLYGATSDPEARSIGREQLIVLGNRTVRYVPLMSIDPSAGRSLVPLTLQYMYALSKRTDTQEIRRLDILDFHRIEGVYLFRHDSRPKNVVLHQDMSVIRDKNSDIKWRHAPWLYERIEGRLFSATDHIFSVRENAVARYAKIYPAMAHKFSFIPTWVDTAVFYPAPNDERREQARNDFRKRLGLLSSVRLLVFVGRLDRQKDPLLLLEAFRLTVPKVNDIHLVVVGDGALRPQVEAAAQSESLRGRVTLLGVQNRYAIADVLRASDLFVLSSAYEGMPIAVLEALASGVPIASTDVGELRRIIRNGVNGFLCQDRTAESLSEAMFAGLNALRALPRLACVQSVLPYQPETVLAGIYENHRRQIGLTGRKSVKG